MLQLLPPRALRLFLVLLALPLLPRGAAAQGMVQLTLRGAIELRGGNRVQVTVGGNVLREDKTQEARELAFSVHLAQGTTASEVLALLQRRLDDAGFVTLVSSPSEGEARNHTNLFVEQVLFLELRVGGGLTATVTTCDGPLRTLRFLAAQALPAAGSLHVSGSGRHPHDQRLSRRGFDLDMAEGEHPAALSERIFKVATEAGWIAQRSGPTEWSPVRWQDGSAIEGMSVEIVSQGDWSLRLELPRGGSQ